MKRYLIVRNHEDQYSIWAAERPLPAGWTDTGDGGSEEECLARIATVWTDMRPRSLREVGLSDNTDTLGR